MRAGWIGLLLALACGEARAQAPAVLDSTPAAPDSTPAAPDSAPATLDSTPAIESARAWLEALDGGRFGATWEDASPLLRQSVPKLQWEVNLDRARAPLGVVIHRKVRQANCQRGTPADPEAEVCLIVYDTRFENRPLTTELVSPIRGRDGVWRVSAYVLR
jgi:hypothetical protein